MRRLVWLTVLAIALAVPAVGYAVEGGSPDDGTLSVKAGAGRIYLNITGTVVGRLYRGSIQVIDPNPADGQGADFFGCDNSGPVDKTASTSFCRSDGKDGVVRFRAIGGKYVITVRGSGIFLSAVGHGWTTLNGAGDTGVADGTYSLNDGPYKSLPDELRPFTIAAPAGG